MWYKFKNIFYRYCPFRHIGYDLEFCFFTLLYTMQQRDSCPKLHFILIYWTKPQSKAMITIDKATLPKSIPANIHRKPIIKNMLSTQAKISVKEIFQLSIKRGNVVTSSVDVLSANLPYGGVADDSFPHHIYVRFKTRFGIRTRFCLFIVSCFKCISTCIQYHTYIAFHLTIHTMAFALASGILWKALVPKILSEFLPRVWW